MAKSRLSKIREMVKPYGGLIQPEDFRSLRTKKGTLKTRFTELEYERFVYEFQVFEQSQIALAQQTIEQFINMENWQKYRPHPGETFTSKVNDWAAEILSWENGTLVLSRGLQIAKQTGELKYIQAHAYEYDVDVLHLPNLMPYMYKAAEQIKIEIWEAQRKRAEELARRAAETEWQDYDSFANEYGLPEEFIGRYK